MKTEVIKAADSHVPWQVWFIAETTDEVSYAEKSATSDPINGWERMKDGRLGLYIFGFRDEQMARDHAGVLQDLRC